MSDSQNLVVVRQSTDLVALDEIETALRTGVAPAEATEERDPAEVAQELIEQLLSAATDEELERPEAEGWGEHVGVPFEVQSFVWRPSTYQEGQAIFLVVRALDMRDGRLRVLTTGSGQVIAQLVNRAKRGTLPAILELTSAETKKGNTVYWLKTPEAVAEQRRQEALEEARAAEAAAAGNDDAAGSDS